MNKSEIFGGFVRDLRKSNDLTLTKLAAALDLDQATLSKVENNKRVLPKECLTKLSSVLGINITEVEQKYFSDIIVDLLSNTQDSVQILKYTLKKLK